MTTELLPTLYFIFVSCIILIYVFIIIALIFNKKIAPFNNAFWTLWINYGVLDVLSAVSYRIWNSDTAVPWFQWRNLVVSIFFFLLCFCLFVAVCFGAFFVC